MLFAFILYFVLILGIGIFFFLRTKSSGQKEYFLGGRTIGPWVTAMSAQASDMSGWLLMGFPGSILAFGLGKIWIGIGLAAGTIANWLLVARRLRRFSAEANDSITLPQYLTNRFASQKKGLKVTCAIIFLVAFTIYVASGFNAGTAVMVAVIPALAGKEMLAMGIFAAIILCYTFLGGYKAVCWTDFFQGIMMLCALLLVPIVMASTGKFDATYAGAFADGVKAFGDNPFSVSAGDIISGLGWGLGYFGMPHILVRFMGIKSSKVVKKSAAVACTWVVITLAAAIAIAILGRTYLLSDGASVAGTLLPAGTQQNIFVVIVKDLFPGFVAGILLAAIIAAAMSTADSQLLVASSSFTSDIYQPIIRKNKASDKETIWVGRLVVALVAVVAFIIASSGIGKANSWASSIMNMVENAWGIFGAAFGPVVILSLFWRRFNYAGAMSGIIAGAVTDILWLIFLTGKTGIYEIVPGFAVGLIVSIVVTLCTKAPGKEVTDIFDAASAKETE